MFDYRTNATTIQPIAFDSLMGSCVRLIFGSVWKGDERVYQQQGFVLAPNF